MPFPSNEPTVSSRSHKPSAVFQVIDMPSNSTLELTALSRDGRTAVGSVGRSYDDRLPAVWNERSGLHILGTFGGRTGIATGVSGDGRIVVGVAGTTHTELREAPPLGMIDAVITRPFVFDGRMRELSELTKPASRKAMDAASFGSVLVSSDGKTTVCTMGHRSNGVFRWDPDRGVSPLGTIPEFNQYDIEGISGDGKVIVGSCINHVSDMIGGSTFFIWTSRKGLRPLAPSIITDRCPACVSEDGRVVAWGGTASYYNKINKKWESTEDALHLLLVDRGTFASIGPAPSGGTFHSVLGVSHDGALIIGDYFLKKGSTSTKPFLWTKRSNQVQDLQTKLQETTDLGAKLKGWSLYSVMALSSDTTTVFGSGTDPGGRRRLWRLVVPGGLDRL